MTPLAGHDAQHYWHLPSSVQIDEHQLVEVLAALLIVVLALGLVPLRNVFRWRQVHRQLGRLLWTYFIAETRRRDRRR